MPAVVRRHGRHRLSTRGVLGGRRVSRVVERLGRFAAGARATDPRRSSDVPAATCGRRTPPPPTPAAGTRPAGL